ncbi:hypothetical protein J8J22_23460, partial [Mycobacterium tuberculosis]|nr:hypothetical protein [Mycobacterium tuberculosis]
SSDGGDRWRDKNLESFVTDGQPLFLFGERAGVMEVRMNGTTGLAAFSRTGSGGYSVFVMHPVDAIFAEWRRMISVNVT